MLEVASRGRDRRRRMCLARRVGATMARRSGFSDTSGMSAVERFFTVLWGNMHPILGLIRTDALRRTAGMRACMGTDLLLLTELALQGDFVFVPGHLLVPARDQAAGILCRDDERHRSAQYRLSKGTAARLPLLTLGTRLLGVAWRSSLPVSTRLAMCVGLAGNMPARYFGARLRRR